MGLIRQACGVDYFMLSISHLVISCWEYSGKDCKGRAQIGLQRGSIGMLRTFPLHCALLFLKFPLLAFKLHAIFHVSKQIQVILGWALDFDCPGFNSFIGHLLDDLSTLGKLCDISVLQVPCLQYRECRIHQCCQH